MEVLHFSNNVEMVALAKKLLEAGDYKYSIGHMNCYYRRHRAGEDEPRRCIFGRLMYGHISEYHPFWSAIAGAHEVINVWPEFRQKFPWLDPNVAAGMQHMHDDIALDVALEFTWEKVESMAKTADEEFFAT